MAKSKTKEKKKKKNNEKLNKIRQNVFQVTLLSIILFAIIFCIYHIVSLAINPTDSFLVEKGKIYQEESLIGYVIRDEKIIQTPENGLKLVQIKNEGERVAAGEEIFRYEATNEQELNDKINELNTQIQTALEGKAPIPSSDIKALDNQIEAKINGIQNKNNIQEIREYKADIISYIEKKARISGELSPAGSYINNLINERINIEMQLKNNSRYEKSPIGGIVSYRVDGLESILTPDNFESISTEMLQNLNLTTGQIVTTSETIGKVINNFECYIAVTTDTNDAKNAQVGDNIKIRLSSNQEIPAEIMYIKKENEENILLILKISQGVEELTNYRKISLDLIWWERSGLRVPNTSIIYENGLSYIIKTKAGILNKILVKIVKENNRYSIVTNYTTEELKEMGYTAQEINNMGKISIYDEILSDPDLETLSKELN